MRTYNSHLKHRIQMPNKKRLSETDSLYKFKQININLCGLISRLPGIRSD